MRITLLEAISLTTLAFALACSQDPNTPRMDGPIASTGGLGQGGVLGSTGGTQGASGSPSTGGSSTATGGSPGVGGAPTGTGGTAAGTGGAAPGTGGTAPVAGGSAVGGATTGGDSALGGTGGAVTGTGGTPGSTGGASTGGTAPGGATATGGAGGTVTSTSCTGCAQISVPFTAYDSAQAFEIYIASAMDFSTTTITFKVRKISGKAGGVQIFAKDGEAQNYAYGHSAWAGVNDMVGADWTMLSLNVAAPSDMSTDPFDATQVRIITIQIAAGAPWYSDEAMTMVDQTALVNPTVLQIDEITLSSTGTAPAVGPWTFDADAAVLVPLTSADMITNMQAVSGSTVTWVGP